MRHRLRDNDGKIRCTTCRREQQADEDYWQWSDVPIGGDAVGAECPECNTKFLEANSEV